MLRKVFIILLALFAFLQLLALALGNQLSNLSTAPTPSSNPMDAIYLIIVAIVGAAGLLYALRNQKTDWVVTLIYTMVGMCFFLIAFSLISLPLQHEQNTIINAISIIAPFAIGIGACLIYWKVPKTSPIIMSIVGAFGAAWLGLYLTATITALLASLFALYDVISVYITKHMVTFATELSKLKTIPAIELNIEKERVTLGNGDVMVAGALAVSVMRTWNLIPALFAIAGSTLGLLALIILLERRKGIYPALPPIVGGALGGLGIWALLGIL